MSHMLCVCVCVCVLSNVHVEQFVCLTIALKLTLLQELPQVFFLTGNTVRLVHTVDTRYGLDSRLSSSFLLYVHVLYYNNRKQLSFT